MIYTFLSLRGVGFAVGALLVVLHLVALLRAAGVREWLRNFPRSKAIGIVLVMIDTVWAFWLIATIDLGEFSNFQMPLMILIPIAAGLTIKFVDEFLAVRALGMLLLLMAEPILEAAFLRPETSRLLVVVLAYFWVVLGMFWVGMPYLMRDQIAWFLKSRERWVAACVAGIAYGGAILICSAILYRSV